MGERRVRNAEVRGSSPLRSTIAKALKTLCFQGFLLSGFYVKQQINIEKENLFLIQHKEYLHIIKKVRNLALRPAMIRVIMK